MHLLKFLDMKKNKGSEVGKGLTTHPGTSKQAGRVGKGAGSQKVKVEKKSPQGRTSTPESWKVATGWGSGGWDWQQGRDPLRLPACPNPPERLRDQKLESSVMCEDSAL